MRRLRALRLDTASLVRSIEFYRATLGMTVLESGAGHTRVGFADASAEIRLRERAPSRAADRNDAYWKIGITLPELDAAYDRLCARGIDVTQPAQFLDVGYLCHLSDPDGHEIELLQHDFASEHRRARPDERYTLGSRATLGQITLRTGDPDAALAFYRDGLHMRLLLRVPVPAYRFTLYFLAFTSEVPPARDLEAVENRRWLWRRPYTTLEIQHRWDGPPPHPSHDAGFAGLEIESDTAPPREAPDGVRIHGVGP